MLQTKVLRKGRYDLNVVSSGYYTSLGLFKIQPV